MGYGVDAEAGAGARVGYGEAAASFMVYGVNADEAAGAGYRMALGAAVGYFRGVQSCSPSVFCSLFSMSLLTACTCSVNIIYNTQQHFAVIKIFRQSISPTCTL